MTTTADTPKQARATFDSILAGLVRLQNMSDADLVEYGSVDLGVIDEIVWGLFDAIEEGNGIEDPA